MLVPRAQLWGQPPPAPRTRDDNNPTLLFSWWCTAFSATIIVVRLCGRKTRSNMLFREDWIMMLALIPLLIRMGLIHVVLLYGTNNVETVGVHYTAIELYHRSIGARLVLPARIFYAMFIWTSKLTVSEFLKRITLRIWRRSYELTLQGIRIFLVVTFVIVVIATLCECQPFEHYWQVKPDPGAHCRQGYGNLIAMGTCDIITDILLIAFPIPIILNSGQTWKRKFQLVTLFSLSIILIVVTALRVPKVIEYRGRQQYRTVWASCEILASASVSNAVILGSFLRDKGTKKNKYKSNSISDSIENSSVRRPTVTALQNTGSDEDLFRFLGIRVPDHLQDRSEGVPRPAPPALPASRHPSRTGEHEQPQDIEPNPPRDSENNSSDSEDSLRKPPVAEQDPVPSPKRTVSFFDVGGLLEDGHNTPGSRSRTTTLVSSAHSGGGAVSAVDFATNSSTYQSRRGSRIHDFALPSTPTQSRRGSRTTGSGLLQDIGGLLTPTTSRTSSGMDRYSGRRQSDSHIHPPSRHVLSAPAGILGPTLERRETHHSLEDVGGLLGGIPESRSESLRQVLSGSSSGSRPAPHPANLRLEDADGGSFELGDMGGLLSPEHEPDASAAALQRATARAQRRSAPQRIPASQPSANAEHEGGWDSLDIHDPGGLLGK